MLMEKLLSFVFSLPGIQNLSLATATLDNAVTVLSAVNFLGSFINIGAAVRNLVFIVVASFVCGIIKLFLSFIP